MKLVSFDPLGTLDIPGVRAFKSSDWLRVKDEIIGADFILFPEYWQVNTLVYAWKKRIFPSVASYHLGHDKIEMTRALEAICPTNVPRTLILPSSPLAHERILDEIELPLVAKRPRSSMGRDVVLIESDNELRKYVAANEILYMQEYLPIYRDLRIVIIGGEAITAYWRQAPHGGFCNNVSRGGAISFDDIPAGAIDLVTRVATTLGIDHAGFDVAEVDGHFYFFEFNVRFGNQALNDRGIRVAQKILAWLEAGGTLKTLH